MERVMEQCKHCHRNLYEGDKCLTYDQQDFWCEDCYEEFTQYYKDSLTYDFSVRLYDC